MKHVAVVFASLVCLAFIVYARSSSEKLPPTASVSSLKASTAARSQMVNGSEDLTTIQATIINPPSRGNGGGFGGGQFGGGFIMRTEEQVEIERRSQLAKMRYDLKRWQPNRLSESSSVDSSPGGIPDRANELETSLRRLEASTLHSFEMSPLFGVGREPPPTERHSQLPNGTDAKKGWQLHEQLSAKLTGGEARWTWLLRLQGITPRGFVYKSNDRLIVAMPKDLASREFLHEVVSADASGELIETECVWNIARLHLVSLLMHEDPVVYGNRLSMGEKRTGKSAGTRELDQFEVDSLERLRTGAERVIAWSDEDDCLQMLSAIRAKESCIECHLVPVGYLLGAFTYRIEEANRN